MTKNRLNWFRHIQRRSCKEPDSRIECMIFSLVKRDRQRRRKHWHKFFRETSWWIIFLKIWSLTKSNGIMWTNGTGLSSSFSHLVENHLFNKHIRWGGFRRSNNFFPGAEATKPPHTHLYVSEIAQPILNITSLNRFPGILKSKLPVYSIKIASLDGKSFFSFKDY